ncbi:ATPase [Erysipelotrichaceae bacterium]|nr:ATPase [Erysipelotrichaceae bacterium]
MIIADYQKGLTEAEVEAAIANGDVNFTPEKITKTTADIIKDNVVTLFNGYNLLIGIALAFVGAYSNMAYLAIIALNITIGILQEVHAKKLVENLSLLSMPKATVVRNGKQIEIEVEKIVLHDTIIFDMGKQVSADSIVSHGAVEVNEALLTGETDVILKKIGDHLLSGSYIVSGKCFAQVEHVGIDNYATKITHEAKKHKQVFSELQRSMRKVTQFTSFLIIPLGIVLFLEAYYLRSDVLKVSVVATAAALLGMLPKGLMLLISISLATGVIKLSKKEVLVQELFSLESLAQVDMLCLDKTGTLTEGKMSVESVHTVEHRMLNQPNEQLIQLFLGAVEDNNATFLAMESHFGKIMPEKVLATIPFSSERKWSSATIADIGTIILGAPERLGATSLPPEVEALIATGMRILVFGFTPEEIKEPVLPKNIEIIAAVSLIDPIRQNARATLDFFREEGVHVKIISGDNPLAVSQIAKQAGFENYEAYIDMSDIELEAIPQIVTLYDIFGRVSPQQKKSLIAALKSLGHTVAMTGDGVNDVLALKEADCSIAMAEGSDAARQVSQLVLLNSDFGSLPSVVMEGRRVVNNATKLASIFFIKTIYSVLLSVICLILLIPFPFIPIQITLIDLAIEGYPSFFMSFEPDNRRIKGHFLPTVFRRAIPNALTIILAILAVMVISNFSVMDAMDRVTIMYYLIGFVSILGVIKASKPLNKLRVFLVATVFIGFYTAAILFADILHISRLSGTPLLVFFVLALCTIPIELFATKATNTLFKKNKIHKYNRRPE